MIKNDVIKIIDEQSTQISEGGRGDSGISRMKKQGYTPEELELFYKVCKDSTKGKRGMKMESVPCRCTLEWECERCRLIAFSKFFGDKK